MAYHDADHCLAMAEQECDLFQVYCERVLEGLHLSPLPAGLAREIATAMV